MTKFILHGGATRTPSKHNDNFFREMINSAEDSITILLVYFSLPKEVWENFSEGDKKKFETQASGRKINFLIASEDVEKFVEQIISCNVIYMRGGKTLKLLDKLKKVKNFKELIKDKVVAGSSAGAYVLSKYYYNEDRKNIFEGLGVLQIKTFCHYSSKMKEKLKEAEAYKEKLPVYAIPETEYVVIEK